MPDDDEARRWIVEPPPAPGEVSLYMAVGDGVELTADQEAALGSLLQTLEADDAQVTGHDLCSPLTTCNKLVCGKVTCDLSCSGLSHGVAAAAAGWNLMGSFTPRT